MSRAPKILATDLSARALRKVAGRKSFFPWLALNSPSVYYQEDDFDGDTLGGKYQSTANGTSSAAAAIDTGVVNGQILLDPGTDDDGRSDLSLGLHFQAILSPFLIVRAHINSAVTTAKLEVGFTDVVSGTDAGAVNVKATPTFNASDAAIAILDTDDNAFIEGVSVDSGTAGPVIDSSSGWVHGGGDFTPTADTFNYIGVFLSSFDADNDGTDEVGVYKIAIWDAHGGLLHESAWAGTSASSAITPTTLLTPWIFAQNRSANRRSVDIDWIGYGQFRTVSS